MKKEQKNTHTFIGRMVGGLKNNIIKLYHMKRMIEMIRGYDSWLTVDRRAEAGEQIIAYDFEGNSVTESELPYYYDVEGELVPKDDEEALKTFLDMDLNDYQDFLKTHYLVTEPTAQDFQ